MLFTKELISEMMDRRDFLVKSVMMSVAARAVPHVLMPIDVLPGPTGLKVCEGPVGPIGPSG